MADFEIGHSKVGLVLGAGGVMGGAWLVGALHALVRATGWDPAEADLVVGTSAGAMIGALVAARVPTEFMVRHSAGEVVEGVTDAQGRPASEASRSAGADFRLHRGLPRLGPGSPRLALARGAPPGARLMALVPRGLISTEPLKDTVRRAVAKGWADHKKLWVVATDYATGERVAFGRRGAPAAELADAVAASCAIPGFYHPVAIGGREYVDGGVSSTSNLDLAGGQGLDRVICLNPMSSRHRDSSLWLHRRLAARLRSLAGRQVGREAKLLRAQGTEVTILQPTAEDLAVMGLNFMSRRRRHQVIETAVRTVGKQLSAVAAVG